MRTMTILSVAMILLTPVAATAGTIHVPGDAPTIQAGINAAAEGDTVLVANGIYTGSGNRDLDFSGKAITVRSAYGPESCIIDCGGLGRGFNFHNGETNASEVKGFTIRNGYADVGGGINCVGASPLIGKCSIENNVCTNGGGGISCREGSSPLILMCTISVNRVESLAGVGGGLYIQESSPTVARCIIEGNETGDGGGVFLAYCSASQFIHNIIDNNRSFSGGGFFAYDSSVDLVNSIISNNHASYGGGILCHDGNMALSSCNVAGNSADSESGGIWAIDASLTIENSIVWDNQAPANPGIDVEGVGATEVRYSDIQGGWSGTGNIADNPRWVSGPLGGCYLSQSSSGQTVNSPCVNAGDPAMGDAYAGMTTRTDCWGDGGVMDMGYHYPVTGLVFGPGPGYDNPPRVRIAAPWQNAPHTVEFEPYGAPHYGTNVACAHYLGSVSLDYVITGPGPGDIYGPHVRGFLVDGTPLPGFSFLAYGTNKFGVNVAAGDLNGGYTDEIITGAGPGAVFGPHVRAFRYTGTSMEPIAGVSFFAYGTQKWGVDVAAGDIDMDGYDEIITGAGPGPIFGAHVRGWDVDGGAVTPIPGLSFMAYGTPRWGVKVSCGDVDGDGIDEIITTPGPSPTFSSHIRGWNFDGDNLTELPGLNFFAWSTSQVRYGANITARQDLDLDGRADIVVGAGPDPGVGAPVKVFRYHGDRVTQWFSLQAFPSGYTHGATVAAGAF